MIEGDEGSACPVNVFAHVMRETGVMWSDSPEGVERYPPECHHNAGLNDVERLSQVLGAVRHFLWRRYGIMPIIVEWIAQDCVGDEDGAPLQLRLSQQVVKIPPRLIACEGDECAIGAQATGRLSDEHDIAAQWPIGCTQYGWARFQPGAFLAGLYATNEQFVARKTLITRLASVSCQRLRVAHTWMRAVCSRHARLA